MSSRNKKTTKKPPQKKRTPRSETLTTEVTTDVPSPVQVGKESPLPDLNSLLLKKHKAKPIPRIGPALALSGGAAHGDFEVGVVKYLYEHGLVPKIICGTSVGAINGLKLAEGEPNGPAEPDADGHVQGLKGLIEIWKSLRFNADMYKMRDPIEKFMEVLKSAAIGVGAGSLIGGSVAGPLGLFIGAFVGGKIEEGSVVDGLKTLLATNSLANFNPLDDLMRKASSFKLDLVKQSNIILRMAMTALEDGALRMVDEQGVLRESDDTPAAGAPRYNAAAQPTLAKIKQLESDLNSIIDGMDDPDTGPKERVAEVLDLRREIGDLKRSIAKDIIGSEPIAVPLTQAALASSSLPVFTPPQLFKDDKNYVDGGTRTVTPIQIALELGATVVYAVVASSQRMEPGESFISKKPIPDYSSANLVDIGMRVGGEIEPSAINESQLMPPNGFPVPVLMFRPFYDIHDSLTVSPGLIDIRMDQGWMCADDVMQAWARDSEGYLDLARQYDELRGTTLIARQRHRIWIEEFAANGWLYAHDAMGAPMDAKGAPPLPLPLVRTDQDKATSLANVRQMKQDLRDLVQARLDAGGNIPPGAERWWTDWERHTWKPTEVLWPLPKMVVKANPDKNIPLGKTITIKFTATSTDGKPIKGATVFAGGKELGPTGSITTTFVGREIRTIDPKTHEPLIRLAGPTVEVMAEGYETTPVPIQFNTGTSPA